MKQNSLRVVITGASSGIGAATAVAFARQGAYLVLGARGREGLEDIATRCREAGGQAEIGIVDVTDAGAVATFAAAARAALGGIDLWFSDVGIGVVGKYLDVPMADHRQVVETNLVSHMNEAHAVLPVFVHQGHGIWVNMISLGGYITSPYAAAYSASKFGLRGFSAALRGEMHDHPDIHICDVYPTFVDTPAIFHAGNYTGARLTYPPGALAPETVANAVVKLARQPRATTVIGMPETMLKLGQFAAPLTNLLMKRFMDRWSRRAEPARDTVGTMYTPAPDASGIHGGQRRHGGQRNTALAVGAAVVGVALAARLLSRRG
ncbi:SDR family oxidoreductase [Pseudoduganella albidiflava]|uniref:SDR family oxidoreductase n=1 Tax=Pseudoduganella albidiflava TaxID=321983 RepID=A0A411X677_9BURK|nr:SDR family oxidoreductase [Pseudoduganella albidiflava]QBI04404.1 SDR family oxidoreductase [Pseudoduganella albidiflava]GGY26975.1 short-chain dehydrogenase [Pseudoduganella albidiflava]